MKKVVILVLISLFVFSGCLKSEEKKENLLKANWIVDEELKPSIEFERSNTNDSYGLFYVDSQVDFYKVFDYLKFLESKQFSIDWRYSDSKTLKELENSYLSENSNSVFSDGYINVKMCRDKKEEDEGICIYVQWVNKKLYNSLNNDSPVSYSFKVEPMKVEENI